MSEKLFEAERVENEWEKRKTEDPCAGFARSTRGHKRAPLILTRSIPLSRCVNYVLLIIDLSALSVRARRLTRWT